jgi:hypothetical protein
MICGLLLLLVPPSSAPSAAVSVSDDNLTEILSFQQKAKCMERMWMAVTLTVKQVIKYFKETTLLTIRQKLFNKRKMNESLICILRWLNPRMAIEMEFNLVVGFL